MGALANVAAWGGASILVGIIGILAYLWLGAERRTRLELERVNRDHDAELAELRAERAELRERNTALNVALDDERSQRRRAEDAAAQAKRDVGLGSP